MTIRLFLLLALPLAVIGQVLITGKIVSCNGWRLKKLRHLKSFLQDFEADEYRGMTVEYQRGRRAQLSIYHDGVFHERVELEAYGNKEELHKMMVDKGFTKKTEKQIRKMRLRKTAEQRMEYRKTRDENVKRQKRRKDLNRAKKDQKGQYEEHASTADSVVTRDEQIQKGPTGEEGSNTTASKELRTNERPLTESEQRLLDVARLMNAAGPTIPAVSDQKNSFFVQTANVTASTTRSQTHTEL